MQSYLIFFIKLNLFLLLVFFIFKLYINIKEIIKLKKPIRNKLLCFIGIHDWFIYIDTIYFIYDSHRMLENVSCRKCTGCYKKQYFKNNKYTNY